MRRGFLSKFLTISAVLVLSMSLVSCSFLNIFKKRPTNESLINNYEEISIISGLEKYFVGINNKVFTIPTAVNSTTNAYDIHAMVQDRFAGGAGNDISKESLISMLSVSEYASIGFSRFYPLLKANFFKDAKGNSALTKDEAIVLNEGITSFKTHLTALDIELEKIRQRKSAEFDPNLGNDKNILSKIRTELNGVIDANLSLSHNTLSIFNRLLADKRQTITPTSASVIRGSLEADALLDLTSVLTVYNNIFIKAYNGTNPLWWNIANDTDPEFGTVNTQDVNNPKHFTKINLVFSLAAKIQSVTAAQFEKAESTVNFVPMGVRDEYFELKQTIGLFFPLVNSINTASTAFPFNTLEDKVIAEYGEYNKDNLSYFVNNLKYDSDLRDYVFVADYNISDINTQQYYFIKTVFENNFVTGIYNPLIQYFDFIADNF